MNELVVLSEYVCHAVSTNGCGIDSACDNDIANRRLLVGHLQSVCATPTVVTH